MSCFICDASIPLISTWVSRLYFGRKLGANEETSPEWKGNNVNLQVFATLFSTPAEREKKSRATHPEGNSFRAWFFLRMEDYCPFGMASVVLMLCWFQGGVTTQNLKDFCLKQTQINPTNVKKKHYLGQHIATPNQTPSLSKSCTLR